MVYFQLGIVEQTHLSNVCCIHVACIAKLAHVKKYGLQKMLEQFSQDICLLDSEGVSVTSNGKMNKVYASLATVSADNLASHDIDGFRMCFSSGHVCRFCMVCYDHVKDLCLGSKFIYLVIFNCRWSS